MGGQHTSYEDKEHSASRGLLMHCSDRGRRRSPGVRSLPSRWEGHTLHRTGPSRSGSEVDRLLGEATGCRGQAVLAGRHRGAVFGHQLRV